MRDKPTKKRVTTPATRMVAGVLGVASLALGLAACGGGAKSPTGSTVGGSGGKSPIVVGYEVPLTGVAAPDGKQEEQGWKIGLKDFGSSVDGHKITTYFTDTQGDPTIAVSDARNLVQQKHINILEGPLLANGIGAVASYVDPLGVPVDDLSLCSAEQIPNYRKYGNGMDSGWTCDQPDLMAAVYMYKDLGYRHVTVLVNDYAFGWISAGGFIKQFELLGGKIDKLIFAPTSTTDYSPYVSSIPSNTQAVFAETVGSGSTKFTNDYQKYGLKGKIPLIGNTTVFDYSVLGSESPAAVTGNEMVAQYCDGINNSINKKFTSEFHTAYNTYPGYYAEAGYTKAGLVVNALKKLNGVATNKKAVANALRTTPIVSARGPVTISPKTFSPIQNIYVCKVENQNGTLHDVPIKTYPTVKPWGDLTYSSWYAEFQKSATGRPSA
ncbi:MAG: ABC transporter substrate-binding protein [Acidimicrobiales bacterium]